MRIYYVVLHYKTLDETIDCINDILLLNGAKEIIVVDNGSNDGTYEKLKEKYPQKNIRIICSHENLGFARGNNLGIREVEDYENSITVVCNSDLRFKQREFGEILERDYLDDKFGVWAPDVMSEDNRIHENPSINEISSDIALRRELRRFAVVRSICDKRLYTFARIINRFVLSKSKKLDWRKSISNDSVPIKVHGACFALGPRFFDVYDGLYEGTFLFQEENILSDMCRRKGLRMVYEPKAKVIHLGSRSYKKRFTNKNERFMNYIENCLASLKSYSEWINQIGNNDNTKHHE